jgi:hypothetical protein
MSKEDDYRRNAAETLDLTRRAGSSLDKRHLLSLAEKWLDLAERAHAVARNRLGRMRPLHPLVRAKIPDLERDAP